MFDDETSIERDKQTINVALREWVRVTDINLAYSARLTDHITMNFDPQRYAELSQV